jgi:hypothetical protein
MNAPSRAQKSSAKRHFRFDKKKVTEITLSRTTSARGGHIGPEWQW